MKAESVQRQHLQELRNTKDKPSPKLALECPSPSRRLNARKSIYPQKQHGQTSSSSREEGNEDQSGGSTTALDAGHTQLTAMPTVGEPNPPTEIVTTKDDKVSEKETLEVETKHEEESHPERSNPSPLLEEVGLDQSTSHEKQDDAATAASPSELSINKVWETIHRDLNSGGGSESGDEDDLDCDDCKEEGEVDTLNELLLDPHQGPLPCSPMVEEEEPSDWEDREENMEGDEEEDGEVRAADAGSAPKKVISECVLISSDEENMPDHHKKSTVDTQNQAEEEEDERLQLDTSSESQCQKPALDFEALSTSDVKAAVNLDVSGSSEAVEQMDGQNEESFHEGTDQDAGEEGTSAEAPLETTDNEVLEETTGKVDEQLEEEGHQLDNVDQQSEKNADLEEEPVPMDIAEENATEETEPAEEQLDLDTQPTEAHDDLDESATEMFEVADCTNDAQLKTADVEPDQTNGTPEEDPLLDKNTVDDDANRMHGEPDAETMQMDEILDALDDNTEQADSVVQDHAILHSPYAKSDEDVDTDSQPAELESAEAHDEDNDADSQPAQLDSAEVHDEDNDADSQPAQLESAKVDDEVNDTDSQPAQLESTDLHDEVNDTDSEPAQLKSSETHDEDNGTDSQTAQLDSAAVHDKLDVSPKSTESSSFQESKPADEPSTGLSKEIIDVESTFSKAKNPELLKVERASEESSESKDSLTHSQLSVAVPGKPKTIEDDDLEVLEVKDNEGAAKEVSGSEAPGAEPEKSEDTKSSETDTVASGDMSKKVSDKEVEMIDLEFVDGVEATTCNSDQNEVANMAAAECKKDSQEETKSVSGNSMDQEKAACDSSVALKKPQETPEIVVLDLENDSESDQKEHDDSDRTRKVVEKDASKEASEVPKTNTADPVEVDLASESAADVNMNQDVEEMDLQKPLKQAEEVENDDDLDVPVRKRHLSQSQHHVNCAEQPKRPKLDLSEEPMEEALQQLDMLRMKEKRSNSLPTKVKLTKEVLEELINRRLHEHINNSQKSIIAELRSRCEGLEKAVDRWKKRAQALQSSITDINAELQKHQKKPRGPTRTVGINVRISTSEPLRPLNSKLPPVLPKPPDPVAKPTTMSVPNVSQSGPVPTHLVPNMASSPSKTFVPPAAVSAAPVHKPTTPQNASLAGGATVKIIDLTDEDDVSAQKSVRQTQGVAVPVSIQQSSVMTPNFSGTGVVLSNALTRTTAPITLQTSGGAPLMGMPVSMPVTMQIIPSVSTTGGGITLRGPRPTVNIQGGMAPHNSRVTTYLVPSGLPAMGSPRQMVPISAGGGPTVVQGGGPRPPPPMQTFLLRMNTVPTQGSNTFTTMTGSNVAPTFNRGPPNVSVTPRNVVNLVASANPSSLLGAVPKTVTSALRPANPANTVVIPLMQKHPAPFPQQPTYMPNPQFKALPPKPALKISKVANGIVLSWNLTLNSTHSEISKYQLYAYQEGGGPPLPTLWKKVGDVKALPLPMACTLTQFMEGNKYHFAICAVDKHNRCGPFSDPSSILLTSK